MKGLLWFHSASRAHFAIKKTVLTGISSEQHSNDILKRLLTGRGILEQRFPLPLGPY